MAKNSKVGHFRGNNSYKGSLYNFIQMKTFDELYLHIISASKSFSGSQEVDPNGKSKRNVIHRFSKQF
jgi:hypothetical protein